MSQEINNINFLDEEQKERSTFFSVLCVLTFIASGFTILASFLLLISGGSIKEVSQSSEFETEFYKAYSGMFSDAEIDNFIDIFRIVAERIIPISIIVLIAALLRFMGAYFMYKLQRKGFHFYLSGQILRFSLPVLVGISAIAYPDFSSIFSSALLPIAFVLMYAIQLNIIKTQN